MAWALALTLAWALFAFGAVYPWASRPLVAAAALLFLFTRPRILAAGTRLLDASILCIVGVAAFQMVPLPPALHDTLSPASRPVVTALAMLPPAPTAWLPLSLAPAQTPDAVGILVAAVLLFWMTRERVHSSGARTVARAVAWMGLLAALLALLGSAVFQNGKLYGFWTPLSPAARPVGPIISKNHFAAWMILGISLTAGYFVAHARSHWRASGMSLAARILGDLRSLWLLAACVLMLAGLILSTSRAGLIGVTAALLFGSVRSWRRLHAGGRAGLIAFLLILSLAAAFLSKPEGVAERLDNSVSDQWGGRPMIWRWTMDMTKPYLLTGIGLGSFETAMSVYQPMPRQALINHAHNQYLQVLAEGGLLMAVPTAIAVIAFLILVGRRMRDDDSPLVSLRQGALAGLVGLATQSVWETPLLTPAVFMLLAVVAGIAVHARDEKRTDD